MSSAAVQQSIRELASSGVGIVSTLAVYETFVPGRPRPDSAALAALPDDVRSEIEANITAGAASRYVLPERLLKNMIQWERDFVAAGGLLDAGADPWGTGLLPGHGNLRNYELLRPGSRRRWPCRS